MEKNNSPQTKTLPIDSAQPLQQTSLETNPPAKKKKILIISLLALVTIFLGTIGLFIAKKHQQKQPKSTQPTPTVVNPSLVSSQISGWKNYQSNEIDVYFEYPPNFRIEEDYITGTGLVDDGIFTDLNQTEGSPSRWLKISRSDKNDFWNYDRLEKLYNLNMGQFYIVPENETIQLTRIDDIQFAGKIWHVFENSEPHEIPAPTRYLITKHGSHYYFIFITYSNPDINNPEYPEYGVNYIQIFDQILSTFKFLD